jgi:hypothetical protein
MTPNAVPPSFFFGQNAHFMSYLQTENEGWKNCCQPYQENEETNPPPPPCMLQILGNPASNHFKFADTEYFGD